MALERRKPLRRSPLKRATSTLKRTRVNPISAKKRKERAADASQAAKEGAAFRRAIENHRCVVCGNNAAEAYAASGYGHEAHHGIPKSVLKRRGLKHLLWSPSNAICVCAEPCHRQHTQRVKTIPFHRLPFAVYAFAQEHDLLRELEREYPE